MFDELTTTGAGARTAHPQGDPHDVRGPSLQLLAAAILVAAMLATPGSANATPVFFEGAGGFGFDAADVADIAPIAFATDSDDFVTAGSAIFDPDVLVSVSLLDLVEPESGIPSVATPFRARIAYELTNQSGRALPDALLVFTVALVDDFAAIDANEFGLDLDEIAILEYQFGESTFFFGAFSLGSLADGQSMGFTLTHVVSDDLPVGADGRRIVPSPGLSVVSGLEIPAVVSVPEPGVGALLLVVSGFVSGFVRARRQR